MTAARRQLVDVTVTRYYHCISRCVRQAMLCGQGREHRKQWIEDRLEKLAGAFSIAVCGFTVMDNHLHVLVRLDPNQAKEWTPEEVLRRWLAIYPSAALADEPADSKLVQAWINQQLKNPKRVAELRDRLANLGWFMKALKEPLSRMANREDECRGAFWESRYKSIAVLDEEALLATCTYIDLNPVAAGVASLPETSRHTSIRQRVLHARRQGKLGLLKAAARGSVAGSRTAGNVEQDHWLCPLDDRRRTGGASREGMLDGFSLGSYLMLVDYTSRIHRHGKARLSADVAAVLDRLGTSADDWNHRITRLLSKPRLTGNYIASTPAKLRDLADRRGQHHLNNVAGT